MRHLPRVCVWGGGTRVLTPLCVSYKQRLIDRHASGTVFLFLFLFLLLLLFFSGTCELFIPASLSFVLCRHPMNRKVRTNDKPMMDELIDLTRRVRLLKKEKTNFFFPSNYYLFYFFLIMEIKYVMSNTRYQRDYKFKFTLNY